MRPWQGTLAAAAALLVAVPALAECPPGQMEIDGACRPAGSADTASSEEPAVAPPPAPPPAPPAPPLAHPEPALPQPIRTRPRHGYAAAAAARPLRPVRAFLSAAQIPPAGVGGYGIVALSARPTPASRERLLKVCRAYIASLPRQDRMPRGVPPSDQMLTVWPVEQPGSAAAMADDCAYLTERYDLYGGTSAIQDAVRQGAAATGRGPFLFGWSPSSSRGARDRLVLVYDLSGYESQDSFDRAFAFWQRRIVDDPSLWRNGWSWEPIRLAARDFFDTYAEAALRAISLAGGGK